MFANLARLGDLYSLRPVRHICLELLKVTLYLLHYVLCKPKIGLLRYIVWIVFLHERRWKDDWSAEADLKFASLVDFRHGKLHDPTENPKVLFLERIWVF